MKEKAIEKINAEMQKDPNNEYIEIIGHYLIDRCSDAQVATAIMNDKKTLADALSTVKKVAQKKAVKGCAVMKDSEVFGIVDDYFGVPRVAGNVQQSTLVVPAPAEKPTPKTGNVINLDFNSFL